MKKPLAILALLFATTTAFASDFAREKRWADEILPAILVGEPIYLEQADKHRFLTLFTEAVQPKAAVIIAHGMGVHPDHGLIGTLRQQLPEAGYTTLSVQMPILKAEAKPGDYPATFDEAAGRLEKAAAFLQAKGYRKIALVSHSMGCPMSYRYLKSRPDAPIAIWVAIGNSVVEDTRPLKMPILDLYGAHDLPAVLDNAPKRAALLKGRPASQQQQIPGANHFFEGKDAALLEAVRGYLDKTL